MTRGHRKSKKLRIMIFTFTMVTIATPRWKRSEEDVTISSAMMVDERRTLLYAVSETITTLRFGPTVTLETILSIEVPAQNLLAPTPAEKSLYPIAFRFVRNRLVGYIYTAHHIITVTNRRLDICPGHTLFLLHQSQVRNTVRAT